MQWQHQIQMYERSGRQPARNYERLQDAPWWLCRILLLSLDPKMKKTCTQFGCRTDCAKRQSRGCLLGGLAANPWTRSLPDQRDKHHGPRRAPHRCCLPMVTVALGTSPPMTLSSSCGNLRSRLPRAAPFFWKGGTLHCSQQPSTHAPSQFTFGIWKDGRTGIRRSRRQCSSDSKYRTGLKDMI